MAVGHHAFFRRPAEFLSLTPEQGHLSTARITALQAEIVTSKALLVRLVGWDGSDLCVPRRNRDTNET
jgi:hypothetical protein